MSRHSSFTEFNENANLKKNIYAHRNHDYPAQSDYLPGSFQSLKEGRQLENMLIENL
jgi:hypothetical protein